MEQIYEQLDQERQDHVHHGYAQWRSFSRPVIDNTHGSDILRPDRSILHHERKILEITERTRFDKLVIFLKEYLGKSEITLTDLALVPPEEIIKNVYGFSSPDGVIAAKRVIEFAQNAK